MPQSTITNAAVGQLQHLRLTEKLDSLNMINQMAKMREQRNVGRQILSPKAFASHSTQFFSHSDIFRQNQTNVRQNYLAAAVCGQKFQEFPKSPLSVPYKQLKMAQKVKSLIEFQSAQNIIRNKPDIVNQKEISSHIKPSLPDLLNLPKKKDNKKYNALAMNYLVKLEQGQEDQNNNVKPQSIINYSQLSINSSNLNHRYNKSQQQLVSAKNSSFFPHKSSLFNDSSSNKPYSSLVASPKIPTHQELRSMYNFEYVNPKRDSKTNRISDTERSQYLTKETSIDMGSKRDMKQERSHQRNKSMLQITTHSIGNQYYSCPNDAKRVLNRNKEIALAINTALAQRKDQQIDEIFYDQRFKNMLEVTTSVKKSYKKWFKKKEENKYDRWLSTIQKYKENQRKVEIAKQVDQIRKRAELEEKKAKRNKSEPVLYTIKSPKSMKNNKNDIMQQPPSFKRNQSAMILNDLQSQFSITSADQHGREEIVDDSYIEVPLDIKEPVEFFWRQLNPKLKGKFKPIARQSSTLIEINKSLHLFGGLSHILLNDHHVLKTVSTTFIRGSRRSKRSHSTSQSTTRVNMQAKSSLENAYWFWQPVQINEKSFSPTQGQSSRELLTPIYIPTARCGHSASPLDGNKMVIFGGQQLFKKKINSRGCLNDVLIYNETSSTWFSAKCQGMFIQGRRNHIGIVWGKNLFVFGGINSAGNTISEAAMLDIHQTKTWRPINISNPDQGLGAIAFCSSALVDPKALGLGDQIRNINLMNKQEQIHNRGVYFFGGLRADGKASGRLVILRKYCHTRNQQPAALAFQKQGKNETNEEIMSFSDRTTNSDQKYQWHEPIVLGKSPPPRYGHSVIFLRPQLSAKSYLVISGGRNDTEYNSEGAKTIHGGIKCFDDLWVLDLTPKVIQNQEILMSYNKPEYQFMKKIKRTLNSGQRVITPPIWIRVPCFGSVPPPRHSHCATEFNGKLLVFGGLSQKCYCPTDVYVLETQQSQVKNLKQLYAKHVAATAGVANSGDPGSATLQGQNSNTFDWMDLNFSVQNDTTPANRGNKVQFQQIQREMFQKSLLELVNNAFFSKNQGGRSSIVKSMIIKNKLQDKMQQKQNDKRQNDKSLLNVGKSMQRSMSKMSLLGKSGVIDSGGFSQLPITNSMKLNNNNNNNNTINTSTSNLMQRVEEQDPIRKKSPLKRSSTSLNEYSSFLKKGSSMKRLQSHADSPALKKGSGSSSFRQG